MTARYELMSSRAALNRVENMPFRWSLNPYRGCRHGCVYCYARTTHGYFGLNPGRDFEEIIFVKTDLAAALRRDLARPGWRFESIAIGTATDPYQPAEGTFKITRACLEILAAAANPCSVTTKGTLLVRDIDIMQELAGTTRFAIYLSLITLDLDLWRRLEPGAPPPASRLRVLDRLRAAGIPTSVFLAPIVPGLTDRPEQLSAVIRAAADHGATGVHPGVLRLAPGIKEWFLEYLQRDYPQLAASYERGYRWGANPPPAYRERIDARIATARAGVEFAPPTAEGHRRLAGRQLTLPCYTDDRPGTPTK